MTVDAFPAGARQNAVREKRVYFRGENQKFAKASRTLKLTTNSLKARLGCKNHNLVTLWMLTLGLDWRQGTLGMKLERRNHKLERRSAKQAKLAHKSACFWGMLAIYMGF